MVVDSVGGPLLGRGMFPRIVEREGPGMGQEGRSYIPLIGRRVASRLMGICACVEGPWAGGKSGSGLHGRHECP